MSYSLKAVCGYLGLPPDTVRKWEARHGLVSPRRLPNGYRVYSEADLQRLLRFAEARRAGLPAAKAVLKAASPAKPLTVSPIRKDALRAVLSFDRASLKRLYDDSVQALGFERVFAEVWIPFLGEVGERAHEGKGLWIAAEHFASAFLRESLLASFVAPRRGAPRLVVASPSGDRHELGMLAAACELQRRGIAVVYLGADLPLASLSAALNRLSVSGVSLTLTIPRRRRDLKALLAELRKRFPALTLFICGQASLAHANLIRQSGANFIGTDLERGVELIVRELRGKAR